MQVDSSNPFVWCRDGDIEMRRETWRDVILKRIEEAPSSIVIVKDQGNFLDDHLFLDNLNEVATLRKCASDLEIFREIDTFENERRKLILLISPKKSVPYAVEQKAANLELTAAMLFPLLSSDILSECGVETYDAVFVHYQHQTELFTPLSRQKSKEFIVRAVFDLDLNNMDIESVVSFFIRLYLKRYKIPDELIKDVRKIADRYGINCEINFELPLPEERFWKWISEQWNAYVSGTGSLVNFNHQALLAVLPTLLNSGVITKVTVSKVQTLKNLAKERPISLMGIDFQIAGKQDIVSVIEAKLSLIENLMAESKFSSELWLSIAKQWGQVRYLQYLNDFSNRVEKLTDKIEKMGFTIEKEFQKFLLEEYDHIVISSTSRDPQTVDKILHYISIQQERQQKIALIVFDGMGMAEWEIIKNYLENNSVSIKSEKQIFTMLPTLTNYSRQAIFSGKLPNEFATTIKGLRENSFFVEFWKKSRDFEESDVLFAHVVPDKGMLIKSNNELVQALEEGTRILGLVFAFIDKRLHGPYDLDVGKRLFHQNIQSFLRISCLADIFRMLIKKGYHIYITSDHGNIVGTGNGITDVRGLVERQGKRCLIYDRKILAEEQQKTTDCSLFISRFVPANDFILFANGPYFFGQIGSKEITHGGVSVEEMVVPFSKV